MKVGLPALAILVSCALSACGQANGSEGRIVVTSQYKKADAPALFKHIGLPMPPATVELYEYDEGMDDMARVVLVMSEADWATMRGTPPLSSIEDRQWDRSQALLFPADHGAWRPSRDKALIAGYTWLPKAEFLKVGYSPAGPGRVRVYLVWGQT